MVTNAPVGNIGIVQPQNGQLPCEGAKCVPANLNFLLNASYLVDLTPFYNNKQFTTLQTIYVDNTQNTSPLTMQIGGTGQTITVPALRGGYFPVLATVPPRVIFSSAGAFTVFVALLNFYLPGQNWGA
jgi:hypothetical protein